LGPAEESGSHVKSQSGGAGKRLPGRDFSGESLNRRDEGSGKEKMSTAVRIEHRDVEEIPFQEASLDIWDRKYRL